MRNRQFHTTELSSVKEALQGDYAGSLEPHVLLKEYTSFGIGGPAAVFTRVSNPTDAASLFQALSRHHIPYLIIGGGTNLLVSDDGFDGVVIHTLFSGLQFSSDHLVRVGAAVPVSTLVQNAIERGLAGLEFAAGLPGSVGGAVAGNAGCFGSCFGDMLQNALVLTDTGELKTVTPEYFEFNYRQTSIRQQNALVVEARFQLTPGDGMRLRETADAHVALRREKHPSTQMKTAGSYFKNLSPLHPGERRRAAGILLEQVGAKLESVGDAAVFEKHANILINRGNATARDMITLETRLKRKVYERFGELLEPEVRFVGNRPMIDEPGPVIESRR